MGFEIYERKRIVTRSPAISISNIGRIGLNQAATLIFKAHAVEFVLLLWDKDRRRMAIRPITKKDKRAYTLSQSKSSSMFSAKSFLEYVGYDIGETRSFIAEWNDQEGILEVEIPAENLKTGPKPRLLSLEQTPSKAAAK